MFVNTSFLIYDIRKGRCFMEYCNRIREIRISHGETQAQLAAILETSQQAYLKYEKGVNEIPVRRIITLCRHYNLSADYILGLTDIPKKLY